MTTITNFRESCLISLASLMVGLCTCTRTCTCTLSTCAISGISARESSNTVFWKAVARKRTVDDSMTCAGSLRNTVWYDNLGHTKNLLAGRAKPSCFPQNNHTQNFGSALQASPLCHKFGLGPSYSYLKGYRY